MKHADNLDAWMCAEQYDTVDFLPADYIPMQAMFDGRLEKYGLIEAIVLDETSDSYRLLVDDQNNCLWVNALDDAGVGVMTWHSLDNPNKVLRAISETFSTQIFSEDDPQYFGCNTEEEVRAKFLRLAAELP